MGLSPGVSLPRIAWRNANRLFSAAECAPKLWTAVSILYCWSFWKWYGSSVCVWELTIDHWDSHWYLVKMGPFVWSFLTFFAALPAVLHFEAFRILTEDVVRWFPRVENFVGPWARIRSPGERQRWKSNGVRKSKTTACLMQAIVFVVTSAEGSLCGQGCRRHQQNCNVS